MRALALACIAAVACGRGGGAPTAKAKPVGPAIDEKTAEKDARGLATEIVDTLARGNKDSLMSLLDPALFVFGPRRVDAYNRTDALVELGKAKKKLALRPGKLEVVPSQGGRSAFVVDTITIEGEPHAVTAILVNTDDIWQVEAALIAPTPTWFAIKAELAKDAVVPVGAVAKGKVDPNANGAVDRYRKGLADQDMLGDDLGARADAIVVGPASGEIARGKKDVKALWQKRLDAKTRAVVSGDVVAQVTPDGQLAWVSSPITMVGEKGDPIPMRAFAVFEKSGADWKLIVLHESVAFDEAGAGATFKKTLPPPPKDKEPDKVAKVDEEKPKKDEPKVKKDEPKAKQDETKKDDKKVKVKDDDEDEKPKAKTAKKDDKKVKKAKDDDEDEKPKAKKDDKKVKKAKADDDEDEKPKKTAKKDDKKAKKAKADDDDEDERPKKTAKKDDKKAKKKVDDDDEEDEKPKKKVTAKKDDKKAKKKDDEEVKRTKGIDGNEKPYERYPGKQKPKKTEEEEYEEKTKKLKQKKEDEKAAKKKKPADDEDEDEKPKKKVEPKKKEEPKKKKPADDEEDDPIVVDD
jgi:hypothetical protein